MKWLLGLTALSLVPVYGLIGWQTGGHGPDSVIPLVWLIEAGAWCLRALVEAWALIYLFQTQPDKPDKILTGFEIALISLIAITVTLVVISNGQKVSISQLPPILFWVWAASVAAFAPLMMGSVGYAYKTHRLTVVPVPDNTLAQDVAALQQGLMDLQEHIAKKDNVTIRRERVLDLLQNSPKPTQAELARVLDVSVQTIKNDMKVLNGKVQ